MSSYNFSKVITTNKDLKVVIDATVDSLRPLGGSTSVNYDGSTIRITNGKIGIMGDFLFNSDATLNIIKKDEGKYIINAQIDKSPSGIFWVLIVCGLCIWPIWLANLYYLLIDLGKEYNIKLNSIDGYL